VKPHAQLLRFCTRHAGRCFWAHCVTPFTTPLPRATLTWWLTVTKPSFRLLHLFKWTMTCCVSCGHCIEWTPLAGTLGYMPPTPSAIVTGAALPTPSNSTYGASFTPQADVASMNRRKLPFMVYRRLAM